MTFSQLRVLQAVARTGSVTRAAEELGTTQPAVSHAVRGLERELGVTLLIRRNNRVSLSAVGRAVSRRADLILNHLEALQQEVAAARGLRVGHLRIGVIPSVNARLMPRLLQAFRATYDRIELRVIEGADAEVLEWAQTGAVDLATVTSTAHDLTTTPLASDRMVAILPASHPLAMGHAVRLEQLAREPFIISTGGCEPLVTDIARRAGVRLRCHYRVRDVQSILAMTAEHLGVTIMPELALPTNTAGVCVLPLEPTEQRIIFLAHLSDTVPLPAANCFIELARHAVNGTPNDPSSAPSAPPEPLS